ncbi:hypothetical protein SSP24_74380 [Streptomyces spinoverrucosus]|uniref:Uncharacterized protein n=1 Tax=Streptomyces spinoverrucosus TaxID=284043 RepID=A0A4Y3VT27_9ACTN|nr:hypothetical protein SSP24_74380 [Streptomyces spinoverrucosus]GHB52339.1 hypothetical protein GCM10010397_22770 [Streptomyces spinoverrucosus]
MAMSVRAMDGSQAALGPKRKVVRTAKPTCEAGMQQQIAQARLHLDRGSGQVGSE